MRREADFPGEPTTIGELMRTPQTTPTRDEAVLREICEELLDKHHGRQAPGEVDAPSFGRGAAAGWDAAVSAFYKRALASLSPAATPVSEAETVTMTRQQIDGLLRAAYPLATASERAGALEAALAKPASSPAGVYVVQTLIDKTEKLIEAAEYGPYTPKPSPWWHPNLADAHSKNPPEAEHG